MRSAVTAFTAPVTLPLTQGSAVVRHLPLSSNLPAGGKVLCHARAKPAWHRLQAYPARTECSQDPRSWQHRRTLPNGSTATDRRHGRKGRNSSLTVTSKYHSGRPTYHRLQFVEWPHTRTVALVVGAHLPNKLQRDRCNEKAIVGPAWQSL